MIVAKCLLRYCFAVSIGVLLLRLPARGAGGVGAIVPDAGGATTAEAADEGVEADGVGTGAGGQGGGRRGDVMGAL